MITDPNAPNIEGTPIDPGVVKVMKAIRQVETRGSADAYTARGDGGAAYGAFQYNEQTGPGWKNIARQYLGDENAPMDKANQNKATYKRIKQWKDEGLSPEEIAARWNGAHKDANGKYQYNAPEYGDLFRKALAEQIQQSKSAGTGYQPAPTPEPFQPASPSQPQEEKGMGRKALEFLFPILEKKERTGLQTLADVGLSAATLIPAGGLAKLGVQGLAKGGLGIAAKEAIPGLVKHGTVAKGAGAGYGYDVASNLSDGKTGTEALTPGLGTATGGLGGLYTRGLKGTKVAQEALDDDALSRAAQIVAPTMTKKNIKEGLKKGLAGRTGALGSRIGIGTGDDTIRMAESIKDLVKKGVIKETDTVEKKANAVLDEIGTVATNLEKQLKTMDVQPILQREELESLLMKTKKNFDEHPILVGDANQSAHRIFNKFVALLPKGRDITASDLLRARKELDRWMKGLGRGNAFDPRMENAVSAGLREIRQGANELIMAKAPNVAVKEMLQKQSAMYDALEAIAENGWREVGTSRTGRFFNKHPVVKEGVKAGIVTGLGGGILSGYVSSKLND